MPKGLYDPKKVDLILLTEKEGLERDQIKSLLEKASPKYRAIISILLSTGCRIGELVSIRVKNVYFNKVPARVKFLAINTRTKKTRQAFLSSETGDIVQEWLKSRDRKESPDDPTNRQTTDTTRFGIYEVILLRGDGRFLILLAPEPHLSITFTTNLMPEDIYSPLKVRRV